MASSPAFLSDEFIAGLFKHVKSWKEVYSLSLVSRQFYHVGQQQQISVPFTINTEVNIYEIPCQMAQTLTVNCNALTEEASINRIINSFVNCVQININFNDLSSLTIIRKICKIIVKKGITLHAFNCYDQEKIGGIIEEMNLKYKKEYYEYASRQNINQIKRKRSDDDFTSLQVPKDPRLRQKFLLEFLLHDSSCIDSSTSSNNFSDTTFIKITNINMYKAVMPITNLFSIGFEEALPQLQQFVNCIINFNSFSILVTSLDVYHHNRRNLDDCAFPSYNIEHTLVAKIHSKTYTNKRFVELSIYAGYFELLVIGGYVHMNGLLHPFLGSSLEKFKFNDESSNNIKIPCNTSIITRTERLLNQYIKRSSHNLWSLHCIKSSNQGFYPISPINYLNHGSQKFKQYQNNHFISQVLNIISSPKSIKNNDIEDLWSLFIRIPFYKNNIQDTDRPTNFKEYYDLLKDDSRNNMKTTIGIIKDVESKTPCFFLSIFNESAAKDIALTLMKAGLKNDISHQHNAIINNIKKEL